jgi:hypothetical protein
VGCESFLEGSHGDRAHAHDEAGHRGLHHSKGHYLTAGQFELVQEPRDPQQALGRIALFDDAGEPIDLGGGSASVAWGDVTGKPDTFPPTIGTTETTAKAGSYAPTTAEVASAFAAKPQIVALGAVADEAELSAVIAGLNAVIAALRA